MAVRPRSERMQPRHLAELLRRARAVEPPYRADAVRRLLPQFHLEPVRAAVTAAVDDPDGRVRRAVAWLVVREWRARSAAPPFDDAAVQRLLTDPDARVRLIVAPAMLGRWGVRALPPLLELLRHPDPDVRSRAVRSIWLYLNRADDPSRVAAAEHALPPLLTALDDPDSGVRANAIEALGSCRDRRAVPGLVATAAVPVLRQAVFYSLGRIGGPEAVAFLAAGLADPRHAFAAASALDDTGDRAAITPLIRIGLAHPSGDVRARVVVTLGALRAREAVPALLDSLADPDPAVAAQAARALGPLGGADAREPLRALLSDERLVQWRPRDDEPAVVSGLVREYAAAALARLDGR